MTADINREIAEIREQVLDEHTDEIAELRTSFEQAQSEITERQDAIVAALDQCRQTVAEHEQAIAQRLEQWHQEAAPTWENITDEIESALPDLNEIEWPEPEEVDDDDALFDSSRSYLEQIEDYKRRKNGGGATGAARRTGESDFGNEDTGRTNEPRRIAAAGRLAAEVEAMSEPTRVVGRACGACSLCCKLLEIGETDKPADQWCPHCRPGKGGCAIYERRPSVCREFFCQWLTDDSLGPEWQPLRCRMVLEVRRMQAFHGHYALAVNVDQSRPQIWREPLYFQQLKAIAAEMPVIVAVGFHFFRIFSTGVIEEQERLTAEELERGRNEYRARCKAEAAEREIAAKEPKP